MQTKNITVQEMDDAGKGLALLATLSAVDHDGDTYLPGAFSWKDGGSQWAPLLCGHDRWMMPFGKARVYEDGDAAFAELHLNLETQAGRDWHAALKFDLATGKSVQEWSYGYDTLDADYQIRGDSWVRVLKKQDVHEVSTVVRGAGEGTRTLAIKGAKNAELKEVRFDALLSELGGIAQAVTAEPGVLSATGRKQLQQIHAALGEALVDPEEIAAKAMELAGSDFAAYQALQARRHLPR
jgi:HK97 family phage prohead protease